ncbi:MAG: exonuclease domain-containing protein [Nitriliruptoraceae bacterium]
MSQLTLEPLEPAPGWTTGPFVALDLETTGVDPATARIVELALIVEAGDGQVRDLYAGLVDPGPEVEIPPGAAAVHGITRARLTEQAAPPASEVLPSVHAHLHAIAEAGWPVVIYNATYDWPLLAAELGRLEPQLELPDCVLLDPLVLDRHVDRYRKGKRTLETACQVYGVALEDAHSARADAVACSAVARRLVATYPEQLALASVAELTELQVRAHGVWRDSFNAYLQRIGAERPPVRETWPGLERLR